MPSLRVSWLKVGLSGTEFLDNYFRESREFKKPTFSPRRRRAPLWRRLLDMMDLISVPRVSSSTSWLSWSSSQVWQSWSSAYWRISGTESAWLPAR